MVVEWEGIEEEGEVELCVDKRAEYGKQIVVTVSRELVEKFESKAKYVKFGVIDTTLLSILAIA